MNGRTSLHLLSDGQIKVDGGVVFGQIPKSTWQDWMPADRRNRVRLGLNCLLVTIGDRYFLIDTGSGQKLSALMRDNYSLATSQLLQALKGLGVSPPDITGVLLSSLHFEHTGGCTRWDRRGDLVPTFPRATYFVQKDALAEALSPGERFVEYYWQDDFVPLQDRGVLEVLDGDAALVPGLHVRCTSGPSLGHQVTVVTHGGERVAYLGDLVPTPYHLQLACISSSDRLPEETLRWKKRILHEAMHEGWLLVFGHGTTDRAGYLEHRNGRPYLRTVDLD